MSAALRAGGTVDELRDGSPDLTATARTISRPTERAVRFLAWLSSGEAFQAVRGRRRAMPPIRPQRFLPPSFDDEFRH